MKIGLHMGTLRGFGSRWVGQCVLREITTARTEHHFEAWVPTSWLQDCPTLSFPAATTVCRPGLLQKFLVENVAIRRAIAAQRIERLFSLGDTSLPGCRVPHLLMVQQAYMTYALPELDFPLPAGFRFKLQLMAWYFQLGLPSVTCFTVQTRTMQQRLSRRWNITTERIVVIPSSIEGAPLLSSMPLQEPGYVCFVASPGPHKNHVVLADMLAALRRLGYPEITCQLTIGPNDVPELTRRARELDVLDRLIFLGPQTHAQIGNLLRAAVAAVIPSKLESFGLPYYEAMAAGCPVIAADRDFAREACGDAGRYARTDDGKSWAEEVARLLAVPADRRAMSDLGREQLRHMHRSWSEIVVDYLHLIEHLTDLP